MCSIRSPEDLDIHYARNEVTNGGSCGDGGRCDDCGCGSGKCGGGCCRCNVVVLATYTIHTKI